MPSTPHIHHHKKEFQLESGAILHELELGYHTFGKLNDSKDNVVWICHALTANSDASDWWKGLVGTGRFFDPSQYFIVCCNMIGSCYGTTGPLSKNKNGKVYGKTFPAATVRDNVKAQKILFDALGIKKIKVVTGGSMGGQQALEWAVMFGEVVEHAAILASGAVQSPWARALNATQRMAIEADPHWNSDDPEGGMNGMKAARAVALLSYRSYDIYEIKQSDENRSLLENYRADSYQRYQGEKLAKRFIPSSYYLLTKTMDSHDIGRGRGKVEEVLASIKPKTIVVGISSDVLFPIQEQKFIAKHVPGAQYIEIHSSYGHDGFLIEFEAIATVLGNFLGD